MISPPHLTFPTQKHQFDYYQANYQQSQPDRAPTSRGRGRGRGRGCGRGRNNSYQAAPNTHNPQPMNQQYQQPGQTQPNLIKRFANWNYCFTHGYDVHGDHTSLTCKKPCYKHNWYATRQNTMNGSSADREKFTYQQLDGVGR